MKYQNIFGNFIFYSKFALTNDIEAKGINLAIKRLNISLFYIKIKQLYWGLTASYS